MPALATPTLPTRFRDHGEACAQCPWVTCDYVPPTLVPGSQILLVGEAPGYWESRQGEYFIGETGIKLNEMLRAVGLTRDEVSLSNALKCYGNEEKSTPEILTRCSQAYLKYEIEYLATRGLKVIIAMGEPALRALTGLSGITGNRGKVLYYAENTDIRILPTFNPAFVLRCPGIQPADLARRAALAARDNPWDKALAAPDFVRQTPDAVEWIVPDLLVRGAITSFAAPRGHGKSVTAMHLTVELARGGTFRGQRLAPARVLYLDRDNPAVVTKIRLVAWGGASERNRKVLTRDEAPDLLQKMAWAQFPAEAFDVVIIDAVGSSTEGGGDREGGAGDEPILARLRDLRAKGGGGPVAAQYDQER